MNQLTKDFLAYSGYALASCSCSMGEQIASCRPNCNSTQLECTCDDTVGGTKINNLDLSELLPNSPTIPHLSPAFIYPSQDMGNA